MKWVLRWKTYLCSFPPSTLLNERRHDYDSNRRDGECLEFRVHAAA
jgi:hypothetical protein